MPREWREGLRPESERWVQLGLISPQQRDEILKLYPQGETDGGRDRTVMIMSILGSLLVGAGVILYFAANWPLIPAWVKVSVIVAATLSSYGAGFYFQYRRDFPRLGQALIFLGSLLYGSGIWLIAQIFHLDTDFPTGFLAWGAGVLPLAWATASRPVLYLATGTLLIWTVGAQTTMAQYNFLFPVLMLGAVLPLARRSQSRLAESAILLGLLLWHLLNVGRIDLSRMGDSASMLMVGRLAILYGAAVLLAGLAKLGDGRTYLGTGGFLSLLGVYMLTFAVPRWRRPDDLDLPSLFAGSPYTVAGAVILLAGVAVGIGLYLRRGSAERRYILPALLLPVAAALLAQFMGETARMVLFNLLLLGGAVGTVAMGIQQRMELLVNLGLVAFAIHLVTRYFDLFFSAMDRSFFFILGGILLLGGGWFLERNRRRWVGDWGGDGDEG